MSKYNEFYVYDPKSPTGLISKSSGKAAGTFRYRKDGSKKQVQLHCKQLKEYPAAHRVIWEIVNGPIPKGMVIDHSDGDPFNNTLSNLRVVTQAVNTRNKKLYVTNTSGTAGVCVIRPNKNYPQGAFESQYYTADKKRVHKTFNIATFGEEEALALAIQFREAGIEEANSNGADYSERHGR